MKAVILTAGIGSRIRPLTDNTPKSLLEVNGKPILQNMLENILATGIHEVGVITGYLEDHIKTYITKHFPTLSVTFIKNDRYLETNTGYSLFLTKEYVNNDDFIKFDADVIFEREVLKRLLHEPTPSALCIDTNIHLDKEEVKVRMGDGNKVLEVGKKLNPHTASGESIGIEKIGGEAVSMLFDELDRLMQDPANHKEYYDDSYTTLVANGAPFAAVDITGMKWVEIDTHDDYGRAQQLFT